MKDKRCEMVRGEIEGLTLNEEFSAVAAEHLQTCADCREFQRQQTKLRQLVGSLDTVSAPADFDFRLRARLAAESQRSGFRYGSLAVKGLATAAIVLVFGVGIAVIWERERSQTPVAVLPPIEPIRIEQPNRGTALAPEIPPTVAVYPPPRRNIEHPPAAPKSKRPVVTIVDFSSERASVITNPRPALDNATVFPIEVSLQSVSVSLDDGRGNARTISFPTVSFGSQRVLATGNQFAPKGAW